MATLPQDLTMQDGVPDYFQGPPLSQGLAEEVVSTPDHFTGPTYPVQQPYHSPPARHTYYPNSSAYSAAYANAMSSPGHSLSFGIAERVPWHPLAYHYHYPHVFSHPSTSEDFDARGSALSHVAHFGMAGTPANFPADAQIRSNPAASISFQPHRPLAHSVGSSFTLVAVTNDAFGAPSHWGHDRSSQEERQNQSYMANEPIQHMHHPPSFTNTQNDEISQTAPRRTQARSKCQDSEPISCHFCPERFTGSYKHGNRARHVRHKHVSPEGAARTFTCRQCPSTFKRSDAKRKHEWNRHRIPDAEPFCRGPSEQVSPADSIRDEDDDDDDENDRRSPEWSETVG